MSSTNTPSRRRSVWLAGTTAIVCAVATLAIGASAGLATAKPPSPTESISQAEVTAMVKAVYADVSDAMRYSMVVAAAEPDGAWPAGSIEAQFAGAFKTMSPQRRQGYRDAAKVLLGNAGAHFGQYGRQSPAEFAARGFANTYKDSPLPVDAAKLGRGLKSHQPTGGGSSDAICPDCEPPCHITGECEPTTPPSPRPKTGLKFTISRVVCIDETGSGAGEWGSDEIALGGLIVTPGGETIQKNGYEIPQGFDDGTVWTFYNNPYTFGTYDLPVTYPGTYTATVMLTEVDSGGFANVLNTVWQQVRGTVQQKIAERVGQVLDPIVKSQLISQALGSLAGYFAVELISWIVNSFYDDVFLQAGSSQIVLNSINDTLTGGVFRFQGHDGIYDVHFNWTWRR